MKTEPFRDVVIKVRIYVLLCCQLSPLYAHCSILKTLTMSHMSIISRILGINVMAIIHFSAQITPKNGKKTPKHLLPLSCALGLHHAYLGGYKMGETGIRYMYDRMWVCGGGGVKLAGGGMRGRLCGWREGGEDGWSAVGGKRKTSAEQKTFRIN